MGSRSVFIRNEKGFSLTELLIYSLLLMLVLSAVYGILMSAVRSWQTGENIVEIQQNARMAMDRMVSELRVCDGIVDTTTYNSTTISIYFWDDKNGNGTNDSDETKRFNYGSVAQPQRLYYGLTNNAALADYVNNFVLTYYQDGMTITTGSYEGANRVKIEMEIEKDGIKKSFTSSAQLRNK